MAITTKTITGKIVIPGTTTGLRATVTATPMTTANALTFPDDNTISWGPVSTTTDATGALTPGLVVPTNQAETAVMWKVVATPIDRHPGLKSWVMGYYSITGTGTVDLADLVEVDVTAIDPGTIVSMQALVTQAETARTGAETARDQAQAFGGTNNTQVAGMVTGAGPTKDALSATMAAQIRNLEAFRAFVRSGGITTTAPLVPIGDSHTDDTTAAQYIWNRLQGVANRTGEGLEGVPSAGVVPMGKNGQTLAYYLANPTQAGGFDAAMALNPSATLSCWLTNDVRLGALGTTVAAVRAAGVALLNQHVAAIKANANRPDFIILRIPAPYTTENSSGQNYITDGTTVNPAGQAQIYTTAVRAAHYDVLLTHPDVLIYDPQTRLFGTTSPTQNDNTNGYFADQIHQSQRGYEAEGDDFAAWVDAAQPRKEGRAFEARRIAPNTPWTQYHRELEDTTRYALVADSRISEDRPDTSTFIRIGPSWPSASPGNIYAGDIIEFVATGTTAVIPSASTFTTSAANTQISFGGGATLASLGAAAVTYLDKVRIYRRRASTDAAVNVVLDDTVWRFKRVYRVENGSSAFLDLTKVSVTSSVVQGVAKDDVPLIASGDKVYVEGNGASPITLTNNFAASGNSIRVTGLSGFDYSTVIGKLVVLVGTHIDKGYGEPVNTVAASSTAQTLADPASGGELNVLTLTGNCTLTFPKAVAGKRLNVVLKQDATGSRTVTWPGTVLWPAAAAPTLTTTAAKSDWFRFVCHDGTNWLGEVVGQNY